MDVQGELQCGQGAGGLDEIAGVAGQAGQRVVARRRVGWVGVRQADGPFPVGGVGLLPGVGVPLGVGLRADSRASSIGLRGEARRRFAFESVRGLSVRSRVAFFH